jgi:O-antigen/teichoic acid export membrane protein
MKSSINNCKSKIVALLRWSEQYTKTDMVYLAGGGFWLVIGQVLMFVFSFLLIWIFANFLDKEVYGTYKFVLAVFSFLSISTLSGMGISIARAVAQNREGFVRDAIYSKIKWGLVGSAGSLVLSLYYYFQNNLGLAGIFIIVAFFVPFAETFADYQFYLQGKKDFKTQAVLRILQRALISIAVIAVILFFKNIYAIIFTYLFSFSIANYLAYKKAIHIHPPNQVSDPNSLSYGYHLSFMSVLRMGATHLDKILLFHFVGPALLAVYFFAIAIPQELTSLFAQINNLAFPKFAEKHGDETKKALLEKIGKFLSVLVIPVAVYILIAPYLFDFFFPQYTDAVFYSQLFVVNILFVPFGLITQFFSGRGNTRILYFINIAEPIFLIILFIVLLPWFGVLGAISAIFIKNILNAIMLLYFLIKDKRATSPIEEPL